MLLVLLLACSSKPAAPQPSQHAAVPATTGGIAAGAQAEAGNCSVTIQYDVSVGDVSRPLVADSPEFVGTFSIIPGGNGTREVRKQQQVHLLSYGRCAVNC